VQEKKVAVTEQDGRWAALNKKPDVFYSMQMKSKLEVEGRNAYESKNEERGVMKEVLMVVKESRSLDVANAMPGVTLLSPHSSTCGGCGLISSAALLLP
jgi:hypothetical protein